MVTTGGSQGGGLAIAAAHLAGGVAATLPEVPFLAHFRRAVEVTDSRPYLELIEYLSVRRGEVDRVFSTLSYLDVVNHAKRITVPACSPSAWWTTSRRRPRFSPRTTITPGRSRSRSTPFNGHDGGGTQHFLAKLGFLASPPYPA